MTKSLLLAVVLALSPVISSAQALQTLHRQCQALAAHSTRVADFAEKLGGSEERLRQNQVPISAVATAGDSMLMVTRECYLLLHLIEVASLITEAEKMKQAAAIIGKQFGHAADNSLARGRQLEGWLPISRTQDVSAVVLQARDLLLDTGALLRTYASPS